MKPGNDFTPHEGDELDPRHEAVWALLGRASRPEPDAWFTARALARCRKEKQVSVSLTRIWRWALGGGLAVCLSSMLFSGQFQQRAEDQKNVQEAFEIMANIDSDADVPSSQDSSL